MFLGKGDNWKARACLANTDLNKKAKVFYGLLQEDATPVRTKTCTFTPPNRVNSMHSPRKIITFLVQAHDAQTFTLRSLP
eukprot:2704987-Amphidinium_carterae.2